jgi:hypothetical protein
LRPRSIKQAKLIPPPANKRTPHTTDDVDSGECGCCNGCITDCLCNIGNDWFATTCCQCATQAQCQQIPPNDVQADEDQTYQGCDLYAPDINIADAVEAASAPGMWFTSQDQLEAYLEATVSVRWGALRRVRLFTG